ADRRRPIGEDPATLCRRIAGDGAVADRQRATAVDAAGADARRVAGNGAVADGQRAVVHNAPAIARLSEVVRDDAVANRQRANVPDASACDAGNVVRDGAVVNRQGSTVVDGPALRARAD